MNTLRICDPQICYELECVFKFSQVFKSIQANLCLKHLIRLKLYLGNYDFNHFLPWVFGLSGLNRFKRILIRFIQCLKSLASSCWILSKFFELDRSSYGSHDSIQKHAYAVLNRFILQLKLAWINSMFLTFVSIFIASRFPILH